MDELTANEAYLDAVLRHAIGLRRMSAGEVKNLLLVLKKADRELSEKLRVALSNNVGKPLNFKTKRIRKLLADIKAARAATMKDLRAMMKEALVNVAKTEEKMERQLIAAALPINIQLAGVDVPTLRTLVSNVPFAVGAGQSRLLSQWFDDMSKADQRRLLGALQQGLAQGESVGEIMARVSGTRRGGFNDGALAMSRRNLETVVRTAISHVSNAAREEIWLANADIIDGLRWVSTLDGRTSAICRARDGRLAPIGNKPLPPGPRLDPPGARPPAHPTCRSVMVAIFNVDGVATLAGNRPYVRDLRTGNRRQHDFRSETAERLGSRWKSMSRTERNAAVRATRTAWAERAVGQVPANTTYQGWLLRQPAEFQDQVLGQAKGRLFRSGGLTLDKFVDRAGNELTLEELAKTNPAAFLAAGIDLEKL